MSALDARAPEAGTPDAGTLEARAPKTRSWLSLYGPFLPLLLICLAPLAFALTKTLALERDMRIAATENMLWVVSQTQMETLALTIATLAPDRSDENVGHRYDLVLSRLSLLQGGPQKRYLEALDHGGTVAAIKESLVALDPLERGHSPELHEALYRLGVELQPQLNHIATDVMTAEWNAAAERLDDYRAVQRMVMLAVGSAIPAALAISWLLLMNQKRLHRAEIMRMRAAVLLEKERDTSAWYRDFAAMISHEIRTPLSLIDSAMHRLARKGDGVTAADVAERHAVVHEAVRRLTRLIESVLLVGRLDQDRIRSALAPAPLAALAEEAVAAARSRNPGRAIVLSSAAPDASAQCDPDLVGHILDNLLSNALKFSAADAPVELRVFAQGGRVACAVSDRGPGVADEDRPRVFERYYRGARRDGCPGTGLGLALSRDLAHLQGGEVTMETWPGKGSVFTLWLPVAARGRT